MKKVSMLFNNCEGIPVWRYILTMRNLLGSSHTSIIGRGNLKDAKIARIFLKGLGCPSSITKLSMWPHNQSENEKNLKQSEKR